MLANIDNYKEIKNGNLITQEGTIGSYNVRHVFV